MHKKSRQRSEVIITMLPDSPDVELVYAGEQGVFAGVKSGKFANRHVEHLAGGRAQIGGGS